MKPRFFVLSCLMVFALSPFQLFAQDSDAAPESAAPWWNETIWYLAFVRSFYDSDGDGIGDIRGMIEKLDYLNDGDPATTDDLGITGLWLLPVHPTTTYHGYDVTDYYGINAEYGSLDDYRELIDAAHARGIRVVLDLVINHSSYQHPWFLASAEGDVDFEDWYIWADENPGYSGPDGQQVWHQMGGRYYYGVFASIQPDLNYDNPAVTQEMFNIVDFWLDDVGIDGFRIDAVKHLIEDGERQVNTQQSRQWMALFNEYVKRVNPEAVVIGEVWSPTIAITPYIEAGSMDMAFEFDLATAIQSSVRSGTASQLNRVFTRGLRDYPQGTYASMLSNHDQPRIFTQLDASPERSRIAATVMLTTPGTPFIYYGEEIGMAGTKPDPRIRTPMQWDSTPVTAGFTTAAAPWEALDGRLDIASVAVQDEDPDSLLNHYRQLNHLRQDHPALSTGAMQVLDGAHRNVFGFLRYDETETLLVLINLSDRSVDDYSLSLEEGPLSTVGSVDILFGPALSLSLPEINAAGGFDDYVPLPEIAPYTSLVIRLNP